MTMRVFYCSKDGVAVVCEEGPVVCKECNQPMANIGWMEYENK